MIFQHHQTSGHIPEATHTPQHSNLTSPPLPLAWGEHHPGSASSTSHAAEFAAASAAVAHTHFNNNMMLTDIHHSASSGGYHQPLGSPAGSSGSAYPLHNGTTQNNVPTQAPLVSSNYYLLISYYISTTSIILDQIKFYKFD